MCERSVVCSVRGLSFRPDEVTGFFKLTQTFQPPYGPRVDSVSNRNEQKCVQGIFLRARNADFTAICEPII
jgi:hypothetical protein